MAAVPGEKVDSYGDGGTYSAPSPAEGVNITSQPQPEVDKPSGDGGPSWGCGSSSQLKTIPFITVRHEGPGHERVPRPLDCPQCGYDTASRLLYDLGLEDNDHKSPSAFKFRDVMVLTQDPKVSDVSGMVQGLCDAKIPVRVVSEEEADVINKVNKVVVTWKGLATTETARRVLVLVPSESSFSLSDFQPVLRQAEHVIWVRSKTAENHTPQEYDTVDDVADGIVLGAISLVNAERHCRDHVQEEALLSREQATILNSSHYHFTRPDRNGGAYSGGYGGTSNYNPNNCCDQLCLACSQDVGENGGILCCACDCCSLCDSCCKGFGHSLNHCVQALCCDCCTSGDGCGDCGDCGDCDCGDCNCDCGDCNCDCGSMDCVIM